MERHAPQGVDAAGAARGDPLRARGLRLLPGLLDAAAQARVAREVEGVLAAAPPARFVTPGGRRMSVAMTSAGRVGWVSDARGYRYEPRAPSGAPWPAIPPSVLAVWEAVSGVERAPDCCLVNLYGEGARMGLHQDRDEGDLSWPVVSISLGWDALFRLGGPARRDPTRSVWLRSGDVVVLGGEARLAHHGVDRLRPGASRLVEGLVEGVRRVNLTLRVVEGA